ncbi:MAG: hypothetical protein ACLPV8_27225 [Steroidobacteraceae bacterium]
MSQIQDHYEIYYADKLWNLLPAVYRALDTDDYNSNGPLREMVNRIGVQAAILRRSVDRMWEDQSIETCDDWLIPYIGALVATNLVTNLDARAQRLDVANTIYYRQRKGTLGLLEELTYDITGWNARAIEFFRRLGRTRHGLDPPIGQSLTAGDDVSVLQQAEGLIGALTRSPIGGTADLRNVYGASQVGTAFDEYFHTADFRFGQGMVGWHNIPRLGVFLWRLKSYGVSQTTPVAVAGCPNWFTFDPTGRDIPLFAAARESDQYGANWVSPAQEQLPGPISQTLYDANTSAAAGAVAVKLYPNSLAVWPTPVPLSNSDALAPAHVIVRPERGRFMLDGSPPPGSPPNGPWTSYYYGFSSEIGAGPYDRRLVRATLSTPAPQATLSGGADALTAAAAIPAAGTLTIGDSLTYDGAASVAINAGAALTVCSDNEQRPLIRLPADNADAAAPWIITGAADSSLVLDGLFISGGDVVINGSFASITITCCTFDPGSASDAAVTSLPNGFAISADDRPLAPTRLWIEATVEMMIIGNSITGPIQTRNGGAIQTLCISNSILQAIPGSAAGGLQSPLSPPESAADAALLLTAGDASLSRCTVLGQVIVHRLEVSESILQDLASVDDTQHGCVRFTAWSQGSVLPSKYESVQIPAQAPIFTSTEFGAPGYCQLLATADAQIAPDTTLATQNTISAGAQDGSEMGAFAREQNPIKQRGLLIKYQEYMPAGLIPVIIDVT